MATRSKAKSAASSAAGKQSAQHRPPAKRGKPEPESPARAGEDPSVNGKSRPVKATSKRAKGKATSAAPKEEFCTCTQGDNGSSMVLCGQCRIWYHFTCVGLAEADAEDICFYVCPSCTNSTGLRTTMTWEGPTAFADGDIKPAPATTRERPVKQPKPIPVKKPVSESESEVSSEDEYVMEDDDEEKKVQAIQTKRRRAAVSSATDTEGSDSDSHKRPKRRLRKISASPAPGKRPTEMKRKASVNEGKTPVKRTKSSSYSAQEDPTRKYCLSKLEELFRDIFFRYPHVQPPDSSGVVSKSVEEMSDEEKEALTQESNEFAVKLEKCIFEIYAEHDKSGNLTAGINYKDRFRTLQFNLSKPDRVVIHQRIASRDIAPKDLSLMSSTDLANEETKQFIKIAEKEALEHSILPKVVAPRAKITHKGIEDIEIDADGPSASTTDLEVQKQREAEAEERRERERMARLKGVERQRTASFSMPPESPTVSQTLAADTWGAPPPVPLYAQRSVVNEGEGSSDNSRESAGAPLLGSDVTGGAPEEPELNLADLINIDEEPTPTSDTIPTPPTSSGLVQVDPFSQPAIGDVSTPVEAAGTSPFSASPTEKPAFNLSTLWSATAKESDKEEETLLDGEVPMALSLPPLSPPVMKDEEPKDILSEAVPPVEGNEPDFDMLFEEQSPTVVEQPVSIESAPKVWTGKLSMPLDSTIPQETPTIAKQVAGPILGPDSLLWKTLFPSDHLRIDGRVPVPSSANYLTQMRLNSARELYAVAFTPATEQDEASFKTLSDFLVQKGRHGLIFPWGARPKDHHPGKELYVIPLKAEEPIPEYMELLDNLKLPKQRDRNFLIGIWIIVKGRLAPPLETQPGAALVPPAVLGAPLASGTPPATITPVPLLQASGIPQISMGSSTPVHVPSTPINPVLPFSNLPPGVDPTALAAEVASLTPEQIQNVIRTLQLTGTPLPGSAHAPPQPDPVHIPPAYPPYMPPHTMHDPLQQPWQGSASPYAPPQYPPYGESRPYSSHASPPHRQNHGGERFNHRQNSGAGGRDRHSKNRRRGGNQHRDNHDRPPVDSGWPRKQHGNHDQSHNNAGRSW